VGKQGELRVTVEGDLPDEVIQQISSAVQNAVRSEMAKIDLLKGFREEDFTGITGHDGPPGLVARGQFG
jgi:hypothetical protein